MLLSELICEDVYFFVTLLLQKHSFCVFSLPTGGWSVDDHDMFLYIMETYTHDRGNQRTLYVDCILRCLPHKTQSDIVRFLLCGTSLSVMQVHVVLECQFQHIYWLLFLWSLPELLSIFDMQHAMKGWATLWMLTVILYENIYILTDFSWMQKLLPFLTCISCTLTFNKA